MWRYDDILISLAYHMAMTDGKRDSQSDYVTGKGGQVMSDTAWNDLTAIVITVALLGAFCFMVWLASRDMGRDA